MNAHPFHRLAAAALVALPLLAPRPGLTQSLSKCVAAKLKAIGKNEKAALGCVAQAAAKNDPASLSGCLAKADMKLTSAFAKATGCDGTLAECGALADDCVDAVTAVLPDPGPSACESARLKAAGKKASSRLTCYAKAATKGGAVDTACLDRASAKFAAAFAKTSGCSGDAATVENAVDDACVDALVTLAGGTVAGICGATASTTTTVSTTTTTTLTNPIDSRPYLSVVPSSYTPGTPMPLVVLLHGYGANAVLQNGYLKLSQAAEAKGFLYAYPDGTVDAAGRRFWNATDACCNFFGSTVDDVGYLAAVIADMKSKYTVDPARVFVVGHSNGGFMAYRLACELSSQVTGIMVLAGATWNDPGECQPALPVTVLHMHGDQDDTILYGGGSSGGNPYPSAAVSASTWATYDGCAPTTDSLPPVDIDSFLAGAETTRLSYDDGCQAGSAVQLWTIQGEGHIPAFSPTWFDPVYTYLMAHPRP
jgi:polyhydroxybutyrate depolymerase